MKKAILEYIELGLSGRDSKDRINTNFDKLNNLLSTLDDDVVHTKEELSELTNRVVNLSYGVDLMGEKANEGEIKAILDPQKGWTYKAKDTGEYWKYDGKNWVNIGEILPSDIIYISQLAKELSDSVNTAPTVKLLKQTKESLVEILDNGLYSARLRAKYDTESFIRNGYPFKGTDDWYILPESGVLTAHGNQVLIVERTSTSSTFELVALTESTFPAKAYLKLTVHLSARKSIEIPVKLLVNGELEPQDFGLISYDVAKEEIYELYSKSPSRGAYKLTFDLSSLPVGDRVGISYITLKGSDRSEQINLVDKDRLATVGAVYDALSSDGFVATDEKNGLLSIEKNKFINHIMAEYPNIAENLLPDSERFDTTIIIGFRNDKEIVDLGQVFAITSKVNADEPILAKIKASDGISQSMVENNTRLDVGHITRKVNDFLVVHVNNAQNLVLLGGVPTEDPLIDSITIHSRKGSAFGIQRDAAYVRFNHLNVRGLTQLTRVNLPNCYLPKTLDFRYNEQLRELGIWGDSQIENLGVNAKSLSSLNASECIKLGLITLVGSFDKLIEVRIQATKVNYKWVSETLLKAWLKVPEGKQGSLWINKSIYDELVANNLLQQFIDKNINITYREDPVVRMARALPKVVDNIGGKLVSCNEYSFSIGDSLETIKAKNTKLSTEELDYIFSLAEEHRKMEEFNNKENDNLEEIAE